MKKWSYKKGGPLEVDNLVVFYYLSASEIWPDKRVAFGGSDLIKRARSRHFHKGKGPFFKENNLISKQIDLRKIKKITTGVHL